MPVDRFLSVDGSLSVDSADDARSAVARIDRALEENASEQRRIDGQQQRLEVTLASRDEAFEDLQDVDLAIRDAESARQVAEFSRAHILGQSRSAMMVNAVDASKLSLQLL